ncbi:MAG: sterol desaturase family protein, partial [Alphaproteobacteria bacterium]|nr:sterol desaturase family protein [Alphaproteobacteria bacterium]
MALFSSYIISFITYFLLPIIPVSILYFLGLIDSKIGLVICTGLSVLLGDANYYFFDKLYIRKISKKIYDVKFPEEVPKVIIKSIATKIFYILSISVFYNTLILKEIIISDFDLTKAALAFLICFIVVDFAFWLSHHLFHVYKGLYKKTHVFHHQSALTRPESYHKFLLSEHLFIGTILFTVSISVKFIFGIDLSVIDQSYIVGYIFFLYFLEHYGMLTHSNHEFISPKLLKVFPFNIITTPCHHAMHHARFHENTSQLTRFWEKCFTKTESK